MKSTIKNFKMWILQMQIKKNNLKKKSKRKKVKQRKIFKREKTNKKGYKTNKIKNVTDHITKEKKQNKEYQIMKLMNLMMKKGWQEG